MATDLTTTNGKRLATIAQQLNRLHGEFLALAGRSLRVAKESGDLLAEAKESVAHGDWEAWLETFFPGSSRTAEAYMRIANRWDEIEAKAQTTADLTLDAALKLLARPKPERTPEPMLEPAKTLPSQGGDYIDSDCAGYFEHPTGPDAPPDEHDDGATASDDEGESEDRNGEEDAGDANPEPDTPFAELLWGVIERLWEEHPEVPAVSMGDLLEDLAGRARKR